MEFDFNLARLFRLQGRNGIVKVDGNTLLDGQSYHASKNSGSQNSQRMRQVVEAMGRASQRAQNLKMPVTDLCKLVGSDQRLYLMIANASQAVGLIKVGRKRLFITDPSLDEPSNNGTQFWQRSGNNVREMEPLCVLDFYVHESYQRKGYGLKLFTHVLHAEKKVPSRLAYDRPSQKFLRFLSKYYDLSHYSPQTNNFVVFTRYFSDPKTILGIRGNVVENVETQFTRSYARNPGVDIDMDLWKDFVQKHKGKPGAIASYTDEQGSPEKSSHNNTPSSARRRGNSPSSASTAGNGPKSPGPSPRQSPRRNPIYDTTSMTVHSQHSSLHSAGSASLQHSQHSQQSSLQNSSPSRVAREQMERQRNGSHENPYGSYHHHGSKVFPTHPSNALVQSHASAAMKNHYSGNPNSIGAHYRNPNLSNAMEMLKNSRQSTMGGVPVVQNGLPPVGLNSPNKRSYDSSDARALGHPSQRDANVASHKDANVPQKRVSYADVEEYIDPKPATESSKSSGFEPRYGKQSSAMIDIDNYKKPHFRTTKQAVDAEVRRLRSEQNIDEDLLVENQRHHQTRPHYLKNSSSGVAALLGGSSLTDNKTTAAASYSTQNQRNNNLNNPLIRHNIKQAQMRQRPIF